MDAAKFLKKSGLSDVVLSRVSQVSFMGDVSLIVTRFQEHLLIAVVSIHCFILGVGLVRPQRERIPRQARVLRRSQARLACSIRREHQREELANGNECPEVRRRPEDETATRSKDGPIERHRLVNQTRRAPEVPESVQHAAASKRSSARKQSRWTAEGFEAANRNA